MNNAVLLIRGYLAAGDAGALDELSTYVHEHVVVHDPNGTITTGLQAEKETWAKARRALPGLRHDLKDVVSNGSTIAARIAISGTLQGQFAGITGTGQPFCIDQAIFMHIHDGKAAEIWAIVDTGQFKEQVTGS